METYERTICESSGVHIAILEIHIIKYVVNHENENSTQINDTNTITMTNAQKQQIDRSISTS
jgi:hypothetical protein